MPEEAYRYEELAHFITTLVDVGTLMPGARAPSLRSISRERKVSMATAMQAYRLLEDRGVLEARPQSGFYVAHREPARQPPKTSRPPARATSVSVSGVIVKLLEHASDPKLVPLGCAIPGSDLLDAGRLDRHLARTAREQGRRLQHLHRPARRSEASARDCAPCPALGPGAVAGRSRHHRRLHRGADPVAARRCASPATPSPSSSPTYFGLLHALEALDLKALELPTDATEGIELAALQEALASRPDCGVPLRHRASTIRSAAPCPTRRSLPCSTCWRAMTCR